MPAQWTSEIVGQMHAYRITKKALALKLGFTPEYTGMVLNGHRDPPGAEERFRAALDELIAQGHSDT